MKTVKRISTTFMVMIIMSVFTITSSAAGTYALPLGTMNGIFNSTTATTSVIGKTFSGYPSNSTMTSVRVKGTLGSSVTPITAYAQILNSNLVVIGQAQISVGNFDVTIPLPSGTPTNGTYYVRFYATRSNTSGIGAITVTNGTAYFNYT